MASPTTRASSSSKSSSLAAAICALLCACHGGASQRNYDYSVEHHDYVDATRGTPANGSAPATNQRSLPTDVWRPIGAGSFPFVLFVHGSNSYRRQSTWLMEALATDGYVVASADFPLTALSTPGGASDWHVQDQLGDLSFLADQLGAQQYAVVGHSTGGTVALLAAEAPDVHDARVQAAVVLSGDSCFFGDAFFKTRALPVLIVNASRDLLVPAPTNGERAFPLLGPPRMQATLLGGTHLFFTDLDVPDDLGGTPSPTTPADPLAQTLSQYGGGTGCTPIPPPANDPPLAFDDQHTLTARIVAAFLDAQIRHEPFAVPADPRVQVSQ